MISVVVVTKGERPAMDLEHGKLPDPVTEAVRLVLKDQHNLAERLKRLEEAMGITASDHELKDKKEKALPGGRRKRWSNDD